MTKTLYKDYFTNFISGEPYAYGLKCSAPAFDIDDREVMFVAAGEKKTIRMVHSSHSRKFLQVHVGAGADVAIEVVLIAQKDCVLDSYIEVLHEGDEGKSTLSLRGYTESNGRIISRIRTCVPHRVFHAHATQSVTLYQFGKEGVVDCIPRLDIQNKTTTSSHAVRLEKVSEAEYWLAAQKGITSEMYRNLKKQI